MFEDFPESPYRVPFDRSFQREDATTEPPKNAPDKKECERDLRDLQRDLADLQRRLYAHNTHSILLVFQATDAAGKDSTIRTVFRGVNPAGFQVHSFKAPSSEELDHDFLWRTACRLPERGRIGIFNRSYYEEVLVVRVHPEYLGAQRLPDTSDLDKLWEHRLQSIRDHEEHLARNGTLIVKFWLNVSKGEQKKRFLDRIDDPTKNWKFSAGDVEERPHWKDYQSAFEQALRHTSTEHAPWYAIPADDKPFMRLTVARIIVDTLKSLDPSYPQVSDANREQMAALRQRLTND